MTLREPMHSTQLYIAYIGNIS